MRSTLVILAACALMVSALASILFDKIEIRVAAASQHFHHTASAPPNSNQLEHRRLVTPIPGLNPAGIRDSFYETRHGRRHEATDIVAPRGAPVVAVDGGTVRKLFTSRQGGLTIYQFDPEKIYCYYYAHLHGYAEGVYEGKPVEAGDLLGYVGSTGNASPEAPHLHFAIFRLDQEKRWWKGSPIDPYPFLARGVSLHH